jgi:hypothetical protein
VAALRIPRVQSDDFTEISSKKNASYLHLPTGQSVTVEEVATDRPINLPYLTSLDKLNQSKGYDTYMPSSMIEYEAQLNLCHGNILPKSTEGTQDIYSMAMVHGSDGDISRSKWVRVEELVHAAVEIPSRSKATACQIAENACVTLRAAFFVTSATILHRIDGMTVPMAHTHATSRDTRSEDISGFPSRVTFQKASSLARSNEATKAGHPEGDTRNASSAGKSGLLKNRLNHDQSMSAENSRPHIHSKPAKGSGEKAPTIVSVDTTGKAPVKKKKKRHVDSSYMSTSMQEGLPRKQKQKKDSKRTLAGKSRKAVTKGTEESNVEEISKDKFARIDSEDDVFGIDAL